MFQSLKHCRWILHPFPVLFFVQFKCSCSTCIALFLYFLMLCDLLLIIFDTAYKTMFCCLNEIMIISISSKITVYSPSSMTSKNLQTVTLFCMLLLPYWLVLIDIVLCQAEIVFLFPVFLCKLDIHNLQRQCTSEKWLVYITRKWVIFLCFKLSWGMCNIKQI
jgi:hypothetical protein